MFIAPSALRARALRRLGHARTDIRVEHGLRPGAAAARRTGEDRPRNRFAFFGQFTPFKGVDVLLEAMERSATTSTATSGSTAPTSTTSRPDFRSEIGRLLEADRGQGHARRPLRPERAARADGEDRLGGRALDLVGDRAAGRAGGLPARPARDLQRHRRHVREGHRRRQRPALPQRATPDSLAETMLRAARTSGLWDAHEGGDPARSQTMDDHADADQRHLRSLSSRRPGRRDRAGSSSLAGGRAPAGERDVEAEGSLHVSRTTPRSAPAAPRAMRSTCTTRSADRRVRARSSRPDRAADLDGDEVPSAATPFTAVNDDPNQYFFWTDLDRLRLVLRAVRRTSRS